MSALPSNFRHLDDHQTSGGTFVDHLSSVKDPSYNGDDLQDGGGGNRQGDATGDPVKPASSATIQCRHLRRRSSGCIPDVGLERQSAARAGLIAVTISD